MQTVPLNRHIYNIHMCYMYDVKEYDEILPFATSSMNACESGIKIASYGSESRKGKRGRLGGDG